MLKSMRTLIALPVLAVKFIWWYVQYALFKLGLRTKPDQWDNS